jgi:hypothetical protein
MTNPGPEFISAKTLSHMLGNRLREICRRSLNVHLLNWTSCSQQDIGFTKWYLCDLRTSYITRGISNEIYETVFWNGSPLWSSGQSSWLQIQRLWVQFLAIPDFLISSGSGTGSTQPCGYSWGATWKRKYQIRSRKHDSRDPLCWPHNTLYLQKLALTSLTSGGCLVGIVRSWTKATKFVMLFVLCSGMWHHVVW